MKIAIINGPNLNLLGHREPGVYGSKSLDELVKELVTNYPDHAIMDYQSNVEGELINKLHEWDSDVDAFIINPGGYSHTSIAIRDAISAIATPVIEVHISNIHAREDFRHTTITGGACKAVISGLGLEGYSVALDQLLKA
jgi:3-dehydroquinate dehydratase-2